MPRPKTTSRSPVALDKLITYVCRGLSGVALAFKRLAVVKPEKFFVETNYWKKELLRLGTYFNENEIEVGGNLKKDFEEEKSLFKTDNRKELRVLLSYEIYAPKNELARYIKKFFSCPGVKIIFSVRPDRDLNEQISEYGLEKGLENLTITKNLKEVENDIDIVAGTYSTLLYEMIGKRKPVVVLKTSLDHGEGMVINGLVDSLDINESNFCGRLNQIKNLNAEVLDERRKLLYSGSLPLSDVLNKLLARFI